MKADKPISRGMVLVSWMILGIMIALATVLTWFMPCHTIDLTRHEGRVDGVVTRKLAIVFDYDSTVIEGLTGTSCRTYQPPPTEMPMSTEERRRSGRREVVPDMEGYLLIHQQGGPDLELQVTPQHLYDVQREIGEFLEKDHPTYHRWIVSNWKVAVIIPAVLYGVVGLMLVLAVVGRLLTHFFPHLGEEKTHRSRKVKWPP